ncbi:transposase [Streptomyces sp. NPDC056194]
MDHGRVIRRHELTDAEWDFVRPLLPRTSMGRPRLDDRTMLNGIVWKFRAGVAWRDVPERYGPWASLHTRFRRWATDGTFGRVLQSAQARADAAGDVDWLVSPAASAFACAARSIRSNVPSAAHLRKRVWSVAHGP